MLLKLSRFPKKKQKPKKTEVLPWGCQGKPTGCETFLWSLFFLHICVQKVKKKKKNAIQCQDRVNTRDHRGFFPHF